MPQTSTKRSGTQLTETPATSHLPRLVRARRRIDDRFYDRPEVRRTLAALILRKVLTGGRKGKASRPESP